MRAIGRRLRRLEIRLAPQKNEQGKTPVQLILERRARFLAQERGVPHEEALREIVAEHEAKSQAFWAEYNGNGSISDILRYSRRCRFEAAADQNSTELVKATR
jgi:hypothetical protein